MNKRVLAILVCVLVALFICAGCSSEKEVEDEEYKVEFNDKTYEGTYTGTFEKDKPVKTGKFVSGEVGDEKYFIYDGEWEDGEIKGNGHLSTNNYIVHFPETDDTEAIDRTGVYDGDVVDLVANGNGTFSATSDENNDYTYEGEWKDGLYNGQGKKYFTNTKEFYVYEGKFVDCEYTPNVPDIIKLYGTCEENCEYKLSDKAYKFVKKNKKVFTKHKGKAISKYMKDDFSVNKFKKDPSTEKPCFVKLTGLTIYQAYETKLGKYTVTTVLANDSDYSTVYNLNYIGKSDKLVEDKTVNVTVMPLGYSTYKGVDGSTPWAFTGFIVRID